MGLTTPAQKSARWGVALLIVAGALMGLGLSIDSWSSSGMDEKVTYLVTLIALSLISGVIGIILLIIAMVLAARAHNAAEIQGDDE